MECTNVICVSKVVVRGLLNQWRDKICEICGCKTMGDFVKYENFCAYSDGLDGIPILGRIIKVRCYTVW